MRVVVVGANGFIGVNLIKRLLKCQYDVIGIDQYDNHLQMFLDNSSFKLIKEQVSYDVLMNVLQPDDAVVCLAAKRLTPNFNLNDYVANIHLNCDIFQSCMDSNTKNVVFLSSISTYRADNESCSEEIDTGLGNLYGESKYAMDHLINFLNKKKEMCIKSLRLAQVIGTGERKGYLLNTLLDNAKEYKEQVIYGSGCGERQYIYIKDVISAIICAIEAKNAKGIYNIGIKGRISISNLAKLINRVFKNEAGIKYLLEKPEDKSILEMDVSKAEKELNFKPKYDLEAAIQDLKNYY